MTITLFSTAIFFAISRTIIRLRYQKRLFVDDVLLAVAVISLCTTMGLLLYNSSLLYLMEAVTTGLYSPGGSSAARVEDQLNAFKLVYRGLQFGSLTATFSIKFSFLLFFRNLIRHLDTIVLYWRVVLVIATSGWAYCVTMNFLSCGHCLSRFSSHRLIGLGASCIALDIITDLLSAHANPAPPVYEPRLTSSLSSRGHTHLSRPTGST